MWRKTHYIPLQMTHATTRMDIMTKIRGPNSAFKYTLCSGGKIKLQKMFKRW